MSAVADTVPGARPERCQLATKVGADCRASRRLRRVGAERRKLTRDRRITRGRRVNNCCHRARERVNRGRHRAHDLGGRR